MSADIGALADQLTEIQLRGIGKDIRAEDFAGIRGRMLSALHSAIAQASELAYLILEFDRQQCCGCGEPAIGRDITDSPICAGCRALEAAALEELAAVEHAIPIQPDGSDR